MAITNFVPEVWAAQLQASLKKALVYAGPSVVNRDYEGEITEYGDTVRITSISRPTVATYTPGSTTVTPEQLTDAQRSLLIDQAKYFAFEVDDVDLRQARSGGALMDEAATEAAYALGDVADQYVVGLYTGVDSGNALGTVSVTTAALAFTQLRKLKVKLDEANVPQAGRYVVVPPWYHGLLLEDDRFVRADASGSTEALRNGQVGRALGFDVLVSNNAPLVTGDDYLVLAGYPGAIAYAEQINKVEAYRPQDAFSDAIKGLHLYGAKLLRPTGIATLVASIT
ncbi:MAG: P22 coat protein - protein 5 domain protein [Acidimicrobiales bacterium]|nr:P22 coat protein - protein 5 domain protein [Acidimicrobiales bacterium]